MIINKNKLDEYVSKLKSTTCPLCGQDQWTISDVIFYTSELIEDKEKGSIIFGGGNRFMPYITITCPNCGNTHIINALVAGLYDFREHSEIVITEDK